MSKKAIVTGGAGFIGSHLVDALIKKGIKVAIIDNLSSGKSENINPKAKFFRLDILSPKIKNIFRSWKPDFLFHYAAQKDIRLSVLDPVFDANVNILGTIKLLEAAAACKVKKVIFASTGGAFSSEEGMLPTPEDKISWPISAYGAAKLSAEYYMYYFYRAHGLRYIALRLANVYGPRQDWAGEAGVVAIFIDKMLQQKRPTIYGTGKQTRDFVYVDDVVRANLLAIKSGAVGSFNVGTGRETSINQIAELLSKQIKFQKKPKSGRAKPGEVMRSSLNIKKIGKEMGWKPKVALVQGLKKTVVWFLTKQK